MNGNSRCFATVAIRFQPTFNVTVFTIITTIARHHTTLQTTIMQPPAPPQPQRRQSAVPGKLPPMPPPGVPIRAHREVFTQPGSYKSSAPSPKSGQPVQSQRQDRFSSYRSQTSSSSSRSGGFESIYGAPGGLRESTRVNIRASAPPRQVSATLDWQNDVKSPREPDLVTPKEQYAPTVGIRDHVDSQFEELLVGYLSALSLTRRTRYRCLKRSDKSSTQCRKTSRRPSSTRR